MKNKKNNEIENKAKTADAPEEEMQELDEGDLEQVSGAGNPFGNRPRMGYQDIDDDLRNNG